MRILLFGSYPKLGQPVTGGLMAVVYALAQGLARRPDLEVAVAAANVQAKDEMEKDGPVTLYRLRVPRFSRLKGQRPLRRGLLAVAEDFQPTLIHAHSTHYYAAAALDGSWPAVITAHGVVRDEAALNDARNLKAKLAWQYDAVFEARVLQRAHTCIAISPYVREAFAGYKQIHWYDIENPVDDAFFDVIPHPMPGCLLSPVRVIPRKGVDSLIQAFAQVVPNFPEVQLRIAGETRSRPIYVARCKQMIEDLGLEGRVHLLGNLPRKTLLKEYAQATGVVLAARQETAPVTVAEALASGCPVIATKVGGMPYQVEHEQTGLLVSPEQPDELAAAMMRLLSSPEQAKAWSEAARRSANRFRLDSVVEKTLAVYEQLLSSTG